MNMEYNIVKIVDRKPKRFSKLLSRLMIVFAVIFVILGIIFTSGYLLPAILLAALYFFTHRQSTPGTNTILTMSILPWI